MITVEDSLVKTVHSRLKKDAEAWGYYLNPDTEFTEALVRSILINEKRYGYWACPCRLASGIREKDLDIICPYDYRDADISQFGACFCGLYVSRDAAEGKRKIESIPERRPTEEERKNMEEEEEELRTDLKLPVWRCKVCGYLCAREQPPDVCPICKVSKDRFERFM